MPLISVFQRQRQVDLYDTEANLVYIRSSRPAKVMYCLERKKKSPWHQVTHNNRSPFGLKLGLEVQEHGAGTCFGI